MSYTLCDELIGPTGVDLCGQGYITGTEHVNLVVVKNTTLELYTVMYEAADAKKREPDDDGDAADGEQGGQARSEEAIDAAQVQYEDVGGGQRVRRGCLRLEASEALFGVPTSLAVVRLEAVEREVLLLSFERAKIVVLEWDSEAYCLQVLSLHQYEDDDLLRGRLTSRVPPRLRCDPEGRLAVCWILDDYLVVLPFRHANAFLDADTTPAAKSSASSTTKSPVLPSYLVDLRGLDQLLVRDVAFLHGTLDPTLLVLSEKTPTWSARIESSRDACALAALTFNVAAQTAQTAWSFDGLPYDCHSLAPVPRAVPGGAFVLSNNTLLYFNNTTRLGLSLNDYAPPAAYRWPGLERVPAPLSLERAAWTFLEETALLAGTSSGELALFRLVADGRSVRRIAVVRVGRSVVPTCMAVARDPAGKFLFLGARMGDSLLLRCASVSDRELALHRSSSAVLPPSTSSKRSKRSSKRVPAPESSKRVKRELETASNHGADLLAETLLAEDSTSSSEEGDYEDGIHSQPSPTAARVKEKSKSVDPTATGSSKDSTLMNSENFVEKEEEEEIVEEESSSSSLEEEEYDETILTNMGMISDRMEDKDEETTKADRSGGGHRYQFTYCDRLASISPVVDFCVAESMDSASVSLAQYTRRRLTELVVACGQGRRGCLATLQRGVRPRLNNAGFELPGYRGLWTVSRACGSHGHGWHRFMLLSQDDGTTVLRTGERLEETPDVGFDTASATLDVGELRDATLAVQLTPQAVLLVDAASGERLQTIPIAADRSPTHSSILHPYVAIVLDRHDILLYEISSPQTIPFSSPQNISFSDPESLSKIHTGQPPTTPFKEPALKEYGTESPVPTHPSSEFEGGSYPTVEEPNRKESWQLQLVQQHEMAGISAMSMFRMEGKGYFATVDGEGTLRFHGLPHLDTVFECPLFSSGIPLLINSSLTAAVPAERPPSVTELCVVTLGDSKGSLPHVFALRDDDSLLAYRAYRPSFYAPPRTQTSREALPGQLPVRLKRVPHRYIGGGLAARQQSARASTAFVRRRMAEVDAVGGRRALAVAGDEPLWLFAQRNALRLYPMDEDAVVAVVPFHNVNCHHGVVYYTKSGALKLAELPSVSAELPWLLTKLPLHASPKIVRYHAPSHTVALCMESTQETYSPTPPPVLPTSSDRTASQAELTAANASSTSSNAHASSMMSGGGGGDDHAAHGTEPLSNSNPAMNELEGASPALPPLPVREHGPYTLPRTVVQHEVQLMSPESWEVIDRHPLGEYERVCAMEYVPLENKETKTWNTYLVVGVGVVPGEDGPAKGRVLVFDVLYYARPLASLAAPRTTPKLRLLHETKMDQLLRAPVSALASMRGYLLVSLASKVMMYRYDGSGLRPAAFWDGYVYANGCSTLRNVALVNDVAKGTALIRWKETARQLLLLGRDTHNLHPRVAELMVDGRTLTVVSADRDGNLHTLYYAPDRLESRGGEVLLTRGDYHMGLCMNRMLPVPTSDSHAGQVSTAVWCGASEGAVAVVLPIDEHEFRLLGMLQTLMISAVPHVAGLNPQAFRTLRRSYAAKRNSRLATLDARLLWQFASFDLPSQSALALRIDSSPYEILELLARLSYREFGHL